MRNFVSFLLIYCKKYAIKEENFDLLIKRFGYVSINFLNSQNIINALNLEHAEFIKYLNIFSQENTKLNNDDINTVGNAFFQREFRLVNQEDYNIFATIENIIKINSQEAKQELEKSKVEAERKVVEAEAEKKANEMKQQSLTDNVIKEKFIEKWNGQLPTVTGGNGIFNINDFLK